MHDPLRAKSKFKNSSGLSKSYFSLTSLKDNGIADVRRLPISLRMILESLVRNCDGVRVTEEHVRQLANWEPNGTRVSEIPFIVGRVVMHELAGIPALGDLAAMRSAASRLKKDVRLIAPKVPVTMVVDHTLAVDHNDGPGALEKNMELEVRRNVERFQFLKWAMVAFDGLKVIPPGNGILHQVNLEYLARGVLQKDGVCYPDTLVGTDSHTVMINGIGVVGWGVGGIDAGAAILGQPIFILTPDVVGVELHGRMSEGVTATDVVLSITEALRKAGVVGAFVEYFGEGVEGLTVPDRATLSNMVPEYGATIGFFAPDEEVCRFLANTGRSVEEIDTFRSYYKAQEMFGIPKPGAIDYTRVVTFDISSVKPSVAGPKRPQDRITLSDVPKKFDELLGAPVSNGGYGKKKSCGANSSGDGVIYVASITSCTNTSNPGVMLAAGLLAKKAVAKGLKTKPWVKTSLTPGSRAVSAYLSSAGLQDSLDQLGFRVVGYGCATCNGMTGPLYEDYEAQLNKSGEVGVAVLSGNRNFEARIHPALKASFLMSPPLVVAYAITGRIDVDVSNDPLGKGRDGKDVYLKDLWPTADEIAAVLPISRDASIYSAVYEKPAASAEWIDIKSASGDLFEWNESSMYIKEPPFFKNFTMAAEGIADITNARALVLLGDTVTTDHISPVTVIMPDSPAGKYLQSLGITKDKFNTYGSRRINHDVMVRGTFANPRLRNFMVPNREGSVALHQPSGEVMSIYDAAVRYQQEGVASIVFGGLDYGMGSARDWAAKGTQLLGVKAVIARSFERIHRTNLAALGVIPCQFEEGCSIQTLNLDGSEVFEIRGLSSNLQPLQNATLVIKRKDGKVDSINLRVRVDTRAEVEYIRNRGVLPYTLRSMLS